MPLFSRKTVQAAAARVAQAAAAQAAAAQARVAQARAAQGGGAPGGAAPGRGAPGGGAQAHAYDDEIAGLADYAASLGWRPLGDKPFGKALSDFARRANLAFYGSSERSFIQFEREPPLGPTTFHAAYGGSFNGRDFAVANCRTPARKVDPIAVVAAELPAIVTPVCVQPKRVHKVGFGREISLGDPAFEQQFKITALDPGFAAKLLTPEIRQVMSARDDWIFIIEGSDLACLGKEQFRTVDDVVAMLNAVVSILAAIPEPVMASQVDHSTDDVMSLLTGATSFEEVAARLASLSPEQRAALNQPGNPLGILLSGITSSEDAKAKFMALDPAQRSQLVAQFVRTKQKRDERRR